MKANSTMSVTIDGSRVVFNFGELGELELDSARLTTVVQTMAMIHGLKQKCVDAAALSRDPATGHSATAQEKYNVVAAMIERLQSGVWNDRSDTGGALLNALVAAYPARSRADLAEWLRGRTDKEKRALRWSNTLKPFLAVTADARGDELLKELS